VANGNIHHGISLLTYALIKHAGMFLDELMMSPQHLNYSNQTILWRITFSGYRGKQPVLLSDNLVIKQLIQLIIQHNF
jgi:hypothetical protein